MELNIFREQLEEDIKLLREDLSWAPPAIENDSYAFNYWVLSNLYNLDLEVCDGNITEYNDKGVDCFVYYEDDKELYIIQNKYYAENTPLNSKDVSDFIIRPLSYLDSGKYTRSPDLQKIYNIAKEDESFKIFLHFYVTHNGKSEDVTKIINKSRDDGVMVDVFYLDDIKDKYHGKSYKKGSTLKATLNRKNKASTLGILPKEYDLPNMTKSYYVMATVSDIYDLWKKSEEDNYPLFEENIREYLGGTSGVNKLIISTLRDEKEREKFFYYNNGITIICDDASAISQKVEIFNPQVVNGCQTVNSIAEVLKRDESYMENYKNVYVMAKILVVEKKDKKDKQFYKDIVKYTNSQNSINEKAFGAGSQPFLTIQAGLKKYGFLLTIKQSDKYQFKNEYQDAKTKGILLGKANKCSHGNLYEFKTIANVQISLEILLQLIGALTIDACFAYGKKSYLLKPTSATYTEFSIKIVNLLTHSSIVKLVILYKRAESDKKNSEDKRSPSPYYLLNFLGSYLRNLGISEHQFFKKISVNNLVVVYDFFKPLSSEYFDAYKGKYNSERGAGEYGRIIKSKVDDVIMKDILESNLAGLKRHNDANYNKFEEIFSSIQRN